jgi:1,2-phenylacetyl-CoA epoxidase PaaB subunit
MHDLVFEVFARKSRGEALRHIGYLDAPDASLARVYAWNTYDEENWFEMCVVPRTAIIPVNRSDGPFQRGTGEGVPASARLVVAETTGEVA